MTFFPAVRVVDSWPVKQLKILLMTGTVSESGTLPIVTFAMESSRGEGWYTKSVVFDKIKIKVGIE